MLSSFLQSVGRTVSGTFDFSGRSSRRDVVDYWIASAIFMIVVEIVLPVSALSWPGKDLIGLLVGVPFLALIARRCHDHGRSAIWALAILPPVVFKFYARWRSATAPSDNGDIGWGWILLQVACVVVVFSVTLMPGDKDDNRYGEGRNQGS